MHNSIKHSKSNEIILIYDYIEKRHHLTIKDNGIGFDPHQQTKGIGLVNISNRAEVLNGKLKLFSRPGGGCVMELIFPTIQL